MPYTNIGHIGHLISQFYWGILHYVGETETKHSTLISAVLMTIQWEDMCRFAEIGNKDKVEQGTR